MQKKIIFGLLVAIMLLSSCSTHRVVLLDSPRSTYEKTDYSNYFLIIENFTVKNTSDLDTRNDINLLKMQFEEYLDLNNQFKGVFRDLSSQVYDFDVNNSEVLFLDVTVMPTLNVKRDMVLDILFFYPFMGYWPFSHHYGESDVLIQCNLYNSKKVLISGISTLESTEWSESFYPYYRKQELHNAFKASYENAFMYISKWFNENQALVFNSFNDTELSEKAAPEKRIKLAALYPIKGPSGNYLSPYTSEGELVRWAEYGINAMIETGNDDIFDIISNGNVTTKGSHYVISGPLNNENPLSNLFSLGIKITNGQMGGLAEETNFEYMKESTELSYDNIEDFILYLFLNRSNTEHWDKIFILMRRIYPKIGEKWNITINKAMLMQ
ncbi:hypothetical protein ACFLQJ_01595 [Calditrichota bacterium]